LATAASWAFFVLEHKMKNGNWVPISKGFLKHLPKDREYTKLEAAYSLQVDYDCNNSVTISGYADLWQWSRKRVYSFLDVMGLCIFYPDNTKKIRNQKGVLGVHKGLHKRDIKGTYKEHIRFIENNTLQEKKNISGTYKGHKGDIKGNTTKEPKNLNPNPKDKNTVENEIYNLYISEIKPSQKSKKRTIANLKKHLKNHTPETLKQSILNYKILAVKKEPNYRKDPANFFGSAEKDQFFADYLPENFEAPETQPTTAPHYHKIMDARAIEEANA
jgi:hypothetical protein